MALLQHIETIIERPTPLSDSTLAEYNLDDRIVTSWWFLDAGNPQPWISSCDQLGPFIFTPFLGV